MMKDCIKDINIYRERKRGREENQNRGQLKESLEKDMT